MIDCYRLWRQVWATTTARKRSRTPHVAGPACLEALEDRCLLSAVMTSDAETPVAAECETLAEQSELKHAKNHARSTPRKKEFPDIAGSWTYTISPGGSPIVGELELSQKGKKVTGTLTREFQDPGAFKGKLKVVRPTASDRDGKDAIDLVYGLFMTGEDVSISSFRSGLALYLILDSDQQVYDKMEGTVKGRDGTVSAQAVRNTA